MFCFVSTASESGSPRLPGGSNQALKWNRISHQGLLPVTVRLLDVVLVQKIKFEKMAHIHSQVQHFSVNFL